MIDYKGYQIELDWQNAEGFFMYHILKDGKYIETYLPSQRAAKLRISKLIKEEK